MSLLSKKELYAHVDVIVHTGKRARVARRTRRKREEESTRMRCTSPPRGEAHFKPSRALRLGRFSASARLRKRGGRSPCRLLVRRGLGDPRLGVGVVLRGRARAPAASGRVLHPFAQQRRPRRPRSGPGTRRTYPRRTPRAPSSPAAPAGLPRCRGRTARERARAGAGFASGPRPRHRAPRERARPGAPARGGSRGARARRGDARDVGVTIVASIVPRNVRVAYTRRSGMARVRC